MGRAEPFSNHYASMEDDDLVRLSGDVISLLPEAREALRAKMGERGLSVEGINWQASPEVPKLQKPDGSWGRFFRNATIFLICDIVGTLVLVALFSPVSLYWQKIGGAAVGIYGNLDLLLAIVTARYLVPKKVRTVWMIGAIGPSLLFVLLVIAALSHMLKS